MLLTLHIDGDVVSIGAIAATLEGEEPGSYRVVDDPVSFREAVDRAVAFVDGSDADSGEAVVCGLLDALGVSYDPPS